MAWDGDASLRAASQRSSDESPRFPDKNLEENGQQHCYDLRKSTGTVRGSLHFCCSSNTLPGPTRTYQYLSKWWSLEPLNPVPFLSAWPLLSQSSPPESVLYLSATAQVKSWESIQNQILKMKSNLSRKSYKNLESSCDPLVCFLKFELIGALASRAESSPWWSDKCDWQSTWSEHKFEHPLRLWKHSVILQRTKVQWSRQISLDLILFPELSVVWSRLHKKLVSETASIPNSS